MAKIFVSYKYGDRDVLALPNGGLIGTTARNYVDVLQAILERQGNHINKGENDDEPLDGFKDETIASKLRGKIYDSTVTIVLISKNMKDLWKPEEDQWIPWEISYSLREKTRDGRTSQTNAVLGVVLPDAAGLYDYFVKQICPAGCMNWHTSTTFGIIARNMFNRKEPKLYTCNFHNGSTVHRGSDHSYIPAVKWADFMTAINANIQLAQAMNENIADFEISKTV